MEQKRKANYINDNLHGTIRISEIEKELIGTAAFNRLHHIFQNSTVYLTFPSCKTKRFEHCIGAMHLAGKIFYNSICNSDEKVIEELMDLFAPDFNGYNFSSSYYFDDDFYNYNMPFNLNEEQETIYKVLYQSIRLAALFHDIGQPPYSHVVEKALLYIIEKNADTKINNSFSNLIKDLSKYFHNFKEKNYDLHEIIGNFITKIVMSEENAKDDFQKAVFKCAQNILNSSYSDEKDKRYFSLHGIIAGSIGVDRLDYISRDRINSGLDNSRINYERLLSDVRILFLYECDELFYICPNIKMKDIVDDILLKRFHIFAYMNFHHRSLKMASLLQKVIIDLAQDELANQKINFPDKGVLPSNISGLWYVLKFLTIDNLTDDEKEKFLNLLIQWDDNYLMTVLKKYLYHKEYNNSEIKKLLEELISNKKVHYSLIKREEDFSVVNEGFQQHLEENQRKITALIDKLNEIIEKSEKTLNEFSLSDDSKSKIEKVIFMKDYLMDLLISFKEAKKRKKHISDFIDDFDPFYDYVFEKRLEGKLNKVYPSLSFSVEKIKFPLGATPWQLSLYNSKSDTSSLYKYNEIFDYLKKKFKNLPRIFVFYSFKREDQKNKDPNFLFEMRYHLGKIILEIFLSDIKETFDNHEKNLKSIKDEFEFRLS